ncbi:MAG: AAA family ATPase [Desulfobulbaceae bacterium]|nr:AAA family ATPase [Desulfobulbaceae bacterium]
MSKRPRLYIFFGLIASGKSTLAEAWAKAISAKYYNSDRVRKELAGLATNAPQQESFASGIYSTAFSQKTYDALLDLAAAELGHNRSVILDGSYQAEKERSRLLLLAQAHKAIPTFILCRCPEEIMKERMALRAQDPQAVSDGRWEIYVQQKSRFEAPDELPANAIITIDTNSPVTTLLSQLSDMLETSHP